MTVDRAYIDKLGKDLTLTLAYALKSGEITEEAAQQVSGYILDNIDNLKTQGEVFEFLTKLAHDYPLFSKILTVELGQAARENDATKTTQVEQLIKENKIDEAIKAAEN